MERIYRIILLGLFVLGFIGAAAAGSDRDENGNLSESPVAALVKDVRLAEEVNALNEGRWNQDVTDIKQDGLARVENLLMEPEQEPGEAPSRPPDSPEDLLTRAKSELAD